MLWGLASLPAGATAQLTCADGTLTHWRLAKVWATGKADLPQDVFRATGRRRLVVVTCGGAVGADGHYASNVVAEFSPLP